MAPDASFGPVFVIVAAHPTLTPSKHSEKERK